MHKLTFKKEIEKNELPILEGYRVRSNATNKTKFKLLVTQKLVCASIEYNL